MRRRDLLVLGASLVGTAAARRVLAQDNALKTRAAVVIGVNEPRGVLRLSGAASGAHTFGDWLEKEGFEVKRFTDDQGPVRIKPITDAVRELVKRPTLEQLVVYFSGHGCVILGSERWLLSDAPEDSNEGINFQSCFFAAQQHPIGNVVFISDACRSGPDNFRMAQLGGGSIIPMPDTVPTDFQPHIDAFFASSLSYAASEVSVDQSVSEFEGIYTSAFLEAFKKPTANMVLDLNGLKVVPNRKLEDFLVKEVKRRATESNVRHPPFPQTFVNAREETYIGRVAADAQIQGALAPQPSVSDVARAALIEVDPNLTTVRAQFSGSSIDVAAKESGFTEARNAILNAPLDASNLSVTSGFRIMGASVEDVVAGRDVRTTIQSAGQQTMIHLEFHGPVDAATVAIRFTHGDGTVVAGLRNFVGNIVVEDGLVRNVSYDGEGYPPEDNIRKLRATVAAAAQLGVFRIQGSGDERKQQAAALGDTLRMGKFADPTLGLYAAYAYHEAALVDMVRSVAKLMRGQLHAIPFDVAMLAGELTGVRDIPPDVVPQCPMLSQGWNFLRAKDVQLDPIYGTAAAYLLPGLWTTFGAPGMALIMQALQQGRFQ